MDIVDGRNTGAVRVSLGYMSTVEDCNSLLAFIEKIYLNKVLSEEDFIANNLSLPSRNDISARPLNSLAHQTAGILKHSIISMYIYPIKSCAGSHSLLIYMIFHILPKKFYSAQQIFGWPLCREGFFLDRYWALVDNTGKVLTQRNNPKMALIRPEIDLDGKLLTVSWTGTFEGGIDESAYNILKQPLVIPLRLFDSDENEKIDTYENESSHTVMLCGQQRIVTKSNKCIQIIATSTHLNTQPSHEKEISSNEWFSSALNVPCSLVHIQEDISEIKEDDTVHYFIYMPFLMI